MSTHVLKAQGRAPDSTVHDSKQILTRGDSKSFRKKCIKYLTKTYVTYCCSVTKEMINTT